MASRDTRDIVGGLLLLAGGMAFSWYAAASYDLGTLRRLGPGAFPAGLGIVLAIFGMALVVPALCRPGAKLQVRVWTPIFVLSGVAAFALALRPLGLIPAVVLVVVISSFAELRIRPVSLAIMCTVLCLVAWLVFVVALRIPVPLFRWPV